MGFLYVALSGVLFGIIPLITMQLFNAGYNTVTVTFYRYLFFIPIVMLLKSLKKTSVKTDKSSILRIVLNCGLISLLTSLLLANSYHYIATGIATTLHFLYPICVILITVFYYRETLSKKIMFAMIMVTIGIFCFLIGMNIDNVLGIFLALASAFTYAIYIIRLDKGRVNLYHPLVVSLYTALSIVIGCVLLSPFMGGIQFTLNLKHIFLFSLVALMSIAATMLFQVGSRTLGSQLTAMLSLSEPITSTIAGFIFLKEPITLFKIMGSAFIFAAILTLIMTKHSIKPRN